MNRPRNDGDVQADASGFRQRLVGLAPVLLLVIVGTVQMVLANTTTLSPWKGGGFGMFASHSDRTVGIWADIRRKDGELETRRVEGVRTAMRAVRHFPSEANLRFLLERTADQLMERGRDVVAVRGEVWVVDFDLEASRIHRKRLRTLEIQPSRARP